MKKDEISGTLLAVLTFVSIASNGQTNRAAFKVSLDSAKTHVIKNDTTTFNVKYIEDYLSKHNFTTIIDTGLLHLKTGVDTVYNIYFMRATKIKRRAK